MERLIRKGAYQGPLILNYVAIGGGASGTHPADLIEFVRRTPDGAVLTIESIMRNVLLFNTIAIALGLHVRVGIEDNLWGARANACHRSGRSNRWCARRRTRARCRFRSRRTPHLSDRHPVSVGRRNVASPGPPPNRERHQRGVPLHFAA